jgi:hypothetical protein
MAAAEIEMQVVVLQMLQQQRMVQRQLELVLQDMTLLLDEACPPEERGIFVALELQDQVLQMLHQQGQIQNHLRLALLRLAVTHGLRDNAVAAAAAQAVRGEQACSSASSANSQALVDAADAGQPPAQEAPAKTGTAAQHATVDET